MAESFLWQGPYVLAHEADWPIYPKSIIDNERTVNKIHALSARGEYGAGEFLGGSVTVPIEQRDNKPFIQMGNFITAYTDNTWVAFPYFNRSTIAQFIVTNIHSTENSDGSGTVTYSGPGASKELMRKILRTPYISTKYDASTVWHNDTSVYLAATHQQANNFYNGGVIEMEGSFADIENYDGDDNRVDLKNWFGDPPPNGTNPLDYTIHFGKAVDHLSQAISTPQTGWGNTINDVGVMGIPGGSFHVVGGRTCLDLINDIAKETGYEYRNRIRNYPVRTLDWFDPNAEAIDSGVYLASRSEFTEEELFSDHDKGVVISCDKINVSKDRWTRVIVSTSDSHSLQGLSFDDITVPSGFTVNFDESMVIHTAAEAGYHISQIFEKSLTYDNLKAASDTSEARKEVKIALFYSAINTLRQRSSLNQTYHVKTVLMRDVLVGEKLYLKFVRMIDGEILFSVDRYLWIRKITLTANSSDGVRYMLLELGDFFPSTISDGNKAVAAALKAASSGGGGTVVFGSPVAGSGITDHGLLTGLGDVIDHPGYLLTTGARALVGDLAVSTGIAIDGVDIGNPGDGIQITSKRLHIAIAANAGLHLATGELKLGSVEDVSTTSTSNITGSAHGHAAVTTDNTNIDISTILAGDSAGRIQLAGLGINTAPTGDKLALAGDIDMVGNINIDGDILFDGAQKITTDAGDLTLQPAVDLKVDADLVFVGAQSIKTSAGNLTLAPVGDLDVDADLEFQGAYQIGTASGNLTLNPTGDLDVIANLEFQGAYQITTTSGDLTIAAFVDLALSPTGGNVNIAAALNFQGPQQITTTSGDLTISPYSASSTLFPRNTVFGDGAAAENAAVRIEAIHADDYALLVRQRADQNDSMIRFEDSSGAALVILTKEGDLESGSPGFNSGATGWQIDHLGNAEFNDLVARGEFHASIFVVDEMHAAGGTVAIMNAGMVAPLVNTGDNTLPAVIDTTFVVNFKASIGSSLSMFSVDDIIRLKFMQHDGSALDVWDVGLEVESIAAIAGRDLANSEEGYFATTCTWRAGGQAALVIPSSTVGVKWGQVNQTADTYVGGIVLTSDMNDAPFIDVFTLPADHTWGVMPDETSRVRMGNLDGVLGLGEEWGIAMATDLGDTDDDAPSVVISDLGTRLKNVDFKVIDSLSNTRALISPAGVVKFGTNTGIAASTSFYFDSTSGDLILGDSGGSHLLWDKSESELVFKDGSTEMIVLAGSGDSYFAGAMKIATDSGGIWQAGGTFSAPVSGLKIHNSGGVGYVDTFGSTGSVGVRLGENGIDLLADTASYANGDRRISWHWSEITGDEICSVAGYAVGGLDNYLDLDVIKASGATGGAPRIRLISYHNSASYAMIGADRVRMDGDTSVSTGLYVGAHGNVDNDCIIADGDIKAVGGLRAGGTADVATGQIVASSNITGTGIYGTLLQSSGDVRASGGIRAGGTTDIANGYIAAAYGITAGRDITAGWDVYATSGIRAGGTAGVGDGEIVASSHITTTAGDVRVAGGIRAGGTTDVTTGYIEASVDIKAAHGMAIGSLSANPASAQLLINHAGYDNPSILLVDTVEVLGMTTQGMVSANAYGQIQKIVDTTGGLAIKGASETTHGVWIEGSANVATADISNSGKSPIHLRGEVDNGTVGGTNSAVSMASGDTSRWFLMGDGEVYSDYSTSMTLFDDEDDMALISTVANALGGDILKSEWDNFVKYNRNDLARLNIVTKTGFVNEHNMTKLFIGAFRQEHAARQIMATGFEQRLSQLETQLGNLH